MSEQTSPYVTTEGIVLHRIRYSDERDLLQIYSEQLGSVSIAIPACRRDSERDFAQRLPSSIAEPLGRWQFVLEHRSSHTQVARLRSCSSIAAAPAHLQPYDFELQAISLFVAELLYRLLRSYQPDAILYSYLSRSLDALSNGGKQKSRANYHLCFLFHLLAALGIQPDLSFPAGRLGARPKYFDLRAAEYCSFQSSGEALDTIRADEVSFLPLLGRITYNNYHRYRLHRAERKRALAYMMHYYRLHLPPFGELRSLEVLSSLFDE